ncbi:gamma-glutamylcyclotransferase (GGCT)/AIG2-like uncharacterized protein YtfP [Dyadobacter jejuensis]|uniref:Gamma-glutamylcyclotransferase (GGCT)/AIG2-like uncharacterized protein YtfP n=1 Tax=Dyadobacter jejuensis TaxID=1082580 RepID=A0A316BC53_9BACT|nr:gamma-glutamylcyclotransferase family protein [Dyadobacter jejuensis]PWJ60057.1 gamma-glutamylcyclotransferase (GGCT)/AIG2-like uncharacterized protein YtfP [Dyadobacter jejuensis]
MQNHSLSEYLFVYGTLMSGHTNPFSHQLQRMATYYAEGYMPGALYRIDWYPGAIYQADSSSTVRGEIYQLNEAGPLLQALDAYEDLQPNESQSEYIRRIVPIDTPDGSRVDCWVYLFNKRVSGLQRIYGGDFRRG